MTQEQRQQVKDSIYTAGLVIGIVARQTKTPMDDKVAKALQSLVMNPANSELLDSLIDIVDTTKI